ncbi:MAG: hypothetical protein B7Z33_00840 [Sphingomonadales bacterium 12-68-11]|nr:MAG: hypothetical protein B7Z33_00840 [Sphingomonadales bacterium 12-68-11]OYX16937.1 MAG: hypothetical protein B7Z07_01420 [Sphingomonadales bacterium 32-67-7]
MIALLKAAVLGAILTFVVSLFMGSGGATGGLVNVHGVTIEGWHFYWSWPLFLIGTGLAFGLITLMDL